MVIVNSKAIAGLRLKLFPFFKNSFDAEVLHPLDKSSILRLETVF
jgi:hypothetical protein